MKNPHTKHTFEDFPVGTPVEVVCAMQDFHFFSGDKGMVIRNSGEYLGVIVEFNVPREYEGGYIMREFNFNPRDLKPLSTSKWI